MEGHNILASAPIRNSVKFHNIPHRPISIANAANGVEFPSFGEYADGARLPYRACRNESRRGVGEDSSE